jgi:hypothetical protein
MVFQSECSSIVKATMMYDLIKNSFEPLTKTRGGNFCSQSVLARQADSYRKKNNPG